MSEGVRPLGEARETLIGQLHFDGCASGWGGPCDCGAGDRARVFEAAVLAESAAEVSRMREALEKIAAHDDSPSIPHSWPVCGVPIVGIARAALASLQHQEEHSE